MAIVDGSLDDPFPHLLRATTESNHVEDDEAAVAQAGHFDAHGPVGVVRTLRCPGDPNSSMVRFGIAIEGPRRWPRRRAREAHLGLKAVENTRLRRQPACARPTPQRDRG